MPGLQLPSAVQPPPQLGGMPAMPDLGAQFKDAQGENQAAMADLAQAKQASAQVRQQGAEKVGQIQAQAPQIPGQQPLPDKMEHKGLKGEELNEAMKTMFTFAAIGGAMTRQPMTAAMNAFAAGLKGLHEGDRELFKRESAEFDRNLKTAMAKNNEVAQKYQLAFEKHKGNLSAAMQQIQLDAAAANDTVTGALARAQNAKGVMSQIQAMMKTEGQMGQVQQRMEQQQRQFDEKMEQQDRQHQERMVAMTERRAGDRRGAATGGFEGKNGEILAALAEKGANLPTGFRSKEQQIGLLNALAGRFPDLSADQIADKIVKGQLDLTGLRKEVQVAGAQSGKIAYAEEEIDQTIPLVREASAKLPRGKFVPYNKIKQMGEKAFSDPDLKEFSAYMTTLSNAYDMLAARGGTDMEKRKKNRELFDTADSPEAVERVLKAVKNEAQASGRAARASMDVTRRRDDPKAAPVGPYPDADKEKRYQEWKTKNAAQ